jgi:hypothetical protein
MLSLILLLLVLLASIVFVIAVVYGLSRLIRIFPTGKLLPVQVQHGLAAALFAWFLCGLWWIGTKMGL